MTHDGFQLASAETRTKENVADVRWGQRRAVIAVAGRRIDALDAETPRFPLEAVSRVRRRLADLFVKEMAEALVCSAACGADLVALEEAERLGLRRRIVLPFAPERFRETSVIDRPGDWGDVFDRLIAAAAASGDLVVLPDTGGSDDVAYAAANEAIVCEAMALAQAARHGAPRRKVVVTVWEGTAREESDATAGLRGIAAKAGFSECCILTR